MFAARLTHASVSEQRNSNELLYKGSTQIGQKRKRCTFPDSEDENKCDIAPRCVVKCPINFGNMTIHSRFELEKASFVDLPQDILLVILSYIGPTSPTLLSLSQLTKQHSILMSQLGEAMLLRARSTFKFLLPKTHSKESQMCMSIRHARFYSNIRENCKTLKTILDKDFIVGCIVDSLPISGTVPDINNTVSIKPLQHKTDSQNIGVRSSVTTEEVDTAINIALGLLGSESEPFCRGQGSVGCVRRDPVSFMKRNIVKNCSTILESKILALCGRCGGKVFKYVKMRLWLRSEGVRFHMDSEDKDNQCYDEERMDKARLIMQLVICRDLELSRLEKTRSKDTNPL